MRKYLAGCVFLSLAACGGVSPEPSYFMLAPVDGATDGQVTASLVVMRPALPDYLDRPGIVRQRGEDEIEIDEMRRWAAPLDTMFEDVLVADLRQRMPRSVIQKQQDFLTPENSFYLETEIDRFNADDRGAVLTAQIMIENRACGKTRNLAQVPFHEESYGNTTRDDLNNLIGRLADHIVAVLRDMKNSAASCGSGS